MALGRKMKLETRPAGRVWLGIVVVLLLGLTIFAGIAYYATSALGSTGGLIVETEPEGASVIVNGHIAGATPLSIKGLSSGAYVLRLEKTGCTPVNVQVQVSGSGGQRVHKKLPPLALGTLTVKIKPDNAEVLLDNELVGHTPL